MQKQTQLSEMPVAALIITIIVMLGLLIGVLYYFAANVAEFNSSIIINPIKEEVVIKTDKFEYETGEIINITIQNNSGESLWYFSDKYSNNLRLAGYKDGEWVNIPMLPLSPMPPDYVSETSELKMGEIFILKYLPEEKINKTSLNYSKYKIGFVYLTFNYTKGKSKNIEAQDVAYSNEFTIKEKTAQNQEIYISTDKSEYELGEEIVAVLNHKGKISQWGYAWSIQKLENNAWVDIQRKGDPYFLCANIPEYKDVNLEAVEECPSLTLCERASWYQVINTSKLVWDQSYKIEEKTFSCDFIERHPRTKDIISSKTENRSCAVFDKAQHGNYKIRFEYTADVDIDDNFSRKVDIKYAEKEFTIKEKQIDFYSCSQDSDCVSVKAGCCGCNAGGTNISINKNYKKEWESKLLEECKNLFCPAVMSDDPSCFAKPRCVGNKCVLE